MAKSIRSKIKKRLRAVKRQRVDAMISTPQAKEHNAALRKVMEGRQVTLARPRNAFKYPQARDAVFPQHEIMKPIDFRPDHLPMAGYVFRGNRRKYEGEQAVYMAELAKTHPKMEVLAGGGAILAATGQKVSKLEAELIATAVRDPEKGAVAAASAASAVAAAAAEDAAEAAAAAAKAAAAASAAAAGATPGGDVDMDAASSTAAGAAAAPEPVNQADHTRRPILKDARRQKRAAEHRPRAKQSTKRGPAPQVAAPVEKSGVKKKEKKKAEPAVAPDKDAKMAEA